MQRLEVSGAVRPLYGSLGFKWLIYVALCLSGRVLRLRCVDLQQIYVSFCSCGSVVRSEELIQFMFPFYRYRSCPFGTRISVSSSGKCPRRILTDV